MIIGGIAIDHIVKGSFLNSNDELLYMLSNLSEANISITSESKDILNARGNLVRRIYRGKTGDFTSTSAFIDMNIMAAGTGSEVEFATTEKTIKIPDIETVKAGEATLNAKGVIAETVKIVGMAGNGAKVEEYTMDTAAGEKAFAVADGVISLPTTPAEGVVEFAVYFEKDATEGMKVVNRGDKFPKAGKLVLKALAIDPCDPEGLVACVIRCPNFQPSPDVELALANDGESTIAYNGTLAVDQCSSNQVLYEIFLFDDED